MRQRINERVDFCREDDIDDKKIRLLSKSDHRCAHCGLPLTSRTMEIEHAIPLDKGGSNDEDNLVALCHECNISKDNYVIHPAQYFKYLNEEATGRLMKMYQIYCEDVSWLSVRSLTREDKTAMRYPAPTRLLAGHLTKKDAKKGYLGSAIMSEAVLVRAKKADLERIVDFLSKYHDKHGLDKDYLKKSVSDVFYNGCIYIVEKQDAIISVLPVSTRWTIVEGKRYWMLKYGGIPCLYQKPEYAKLISDCILYINQGIARSNSKKLAVYSITYPAADQFAERIDHYLSQYGQSAVCENDDGWNGVIFTQRYQEYEGEHTEKDIEFYDEVQFFSDYLERLFKLKSVKVEVDTSKRQIKKSRAGNKQLKKQQHRESRKIDEYDERFYRYG